MNSLKYSDFYVEMGTAMIFYNEVIVFLVKFD